MGLQISRCIYPQTTQKSIVWRDSQKPGRDLSRVSSTERMPNSRRPLDARSRSHLYRDTAKILGGISDRVYQRQKRVNNRPALWWQRTQLYRRTFLGTGL